ncbi:alpha/beta fold hydrolase [Rhodococcus sp. NPDC127528]|uniref:alpha/beta fold hydrolase n=1 Tax=unclassified Rhodococcus (in: high G+C Gram-positive bacteria) TaxID=192944 RepID=UPI003636275D
MDFTTATITTGDGDAQTFVYADSGSGPLVVLFHGFPDLPTGWTDTAAALNAAGYRTVVPYLRGYHPKTIVPERRYGSSEIGEDAIRLLDAIGADHAVFVGHDWGAAVVYRAAAAAPDRVTRLVAVAIPHPNSLEPTPALLLRARHFLTLALPTRTWLARRNDFAYLDTLMRRWAPNWTGPARDATLAAVKRAFTDDEVLDGALRYYVDNRRGGVPRLPQPALLVGGTTDIVPMTAFERSRSRFTGPVDVLIAQGAGHWPHREAAESFHARLLAFLDS